MWRLTEKMVLSAFTAACLRAMSPTSCSPCFVKATTEGVVLPPCAGGDDDGVSILHDSSAAVCGAKINADDCAHVQSFLLNRQRGDKKRIQEGTMCSPSASATLPSVNRVTIRPGKDPVQGHRGKGYKSFRNVGTGAPRKTRRTAYGMGRTRRAGVRQNPWQESLAG